MSTLDAQVLKAIATTSATNNIFNTVTAVSPSGDVYVTGNFRGTLSIGGEVPSVTTTNVNFGSAFLARYSGTLIPLSLRYMSNTDGAGSSSGNSVAVSPSGDVYVTGEFTGTLDIGGEVPSVTTTNENGSAFLARYSGTLTPLSLRYMSNTDGADFSRGSSVAVSSSGDVYVTGRFSGTLDIGGGVLSVTTTNVNGSAFLARYSGILIPLSLRYMSNTDGADYSRGLSVAVSPSGDVYVTGIFSGTLSIGDGVPSVTTNGTSAFLARYSGTLTPLSLRYMSNTDGADYSRGLSVAVSSSGDVYVTGEFTGTLDIGGEVPSVTTNSTSVEEGSAFLVRYSGTLTPLSLRYMSNTDGDDYSVGISVAVSQSGDVYVTGRFSGTLDIGGGVPSVTTNVNDNCFLAKYITTTSTTSTTSTTTHYEPICLVAGTPILTDQGIVAIENIDTAVHTIGNKRIVAVTKAITPEKTLICFEPHSVAINCPTKKTIMTPGHEVLYKGKLVQAKNFVGKLNGVHTIPYDGKIVYNVLLEKHGLMSVNNMIVETLNPKNKVAKKFLNAH